MGHEKAGEKAGDHHMSKRTCAHCGEAIPEQHLVVAMKSTKVEADKTGHTRVVYFTKGHGYVAKVVAAVVNAM